jgi:hypothetical protein
MKNMLIAGLALVLSVVAFSACKNDHSKHQSQTTETAAPGTKYICPMNCEKGKTYDQPGSCPVCNMDVEPVQAGAEANKSEYFTAFTANPVQLEAGKSAMLSFTPKIKGNEGAPVPLDLVHEKKMHLILVRDDLSWFDHIHPEFSASGSYDIKVLAKGEKFVNGRGHNETRFDAGGKYWAFTDFKPTGGLNQVHKTELQVAGTPAQTVAYTQPKMTTSVDGYTIALDPHGSTIASGTPAHLHIDIMEKGKRLTPDKIENYLGAKAHVVLVETTTKEFVHVHPEAVGDELEMNTTFAKPGTYRGWLQFQTNGMVHTADFVLKVEEGKPEAAGHEGHRH